MIAITEVLSAEHRVFTELFDQIEGLLPKLTTLPEVKLLTTLVEGLLQGHADAEKNLAYVALDHALKDRGRHASLKRAQTARSFEEARRLLKTSISTSREHFRREEGSIFPLLERVLRPETLAALGTARIQPAAAPVKQTPPR